MEEKSPEILPNKWASTLRLSLGNWFPRACFVDFSIRPDPKILLWVYAINLNKINFRMITWGERLVLNISQKPGFLCDITDFKNIQWKIITRRQDRSKDISGSIYFNHISHQKTIWQTSVCVHQEYLHSRRKFSLSS